MGEFSFSVPQQIMVGRGMIKKLPECAHSLGCHKAYIISGRVLEGMGVVRSCQDLLAEAGIPSAAFAETEGNPSVETVERAAAGFLESGADTLIALGGGSPMDVAKAVGIVARYGGSIVDYEGADRVPGDIVPLIAIPTTAGTGSEVTAFSVITDHSRNYKLTVFSYKLLPACAILDPELLTTAPASVAAACGIDAFIHAEEAYVSKAASPFTEAMSEKAMELIGANIRQYVADRTDLAAAEGMLVGSLFAGIAFSWARLGNVHAMSHPVSAYYNVAHGVANGILLPTIVAYNAPAAKVKYGKIYHYITGTTVAEADFRPEMLADAIRELNAGIGLPASLREVGVTEARLEAMTDDAMKSGNIAVNPRKTDREDVLRLYRMAL